MMALVVLSLLVCFGAAVYALVSLVCHFKDLRNQQ